MTVSMMAIPAKREAVKVTQPDGSTVTIQLHGDEWKHFYTTLDGYTIVKDTRGFYVYAEKNDGLLQPTHLVAHDVTERTAMERAYLADVRRYQAPDMTAQTAEIRQMVEKNRKVTLARNRARTRRAFNPVNFKGLIILVEYNDKPFSRDDYKVILTDMVNKEGFTGYDDEVFTGSVCDYFSDNSAGKFKPQFDIVGPYSIDYSQYTPKGNSFETVMKVIHPAIDAADKDVDFSRYDLDGDGFVDMIYFIFSGFSSNYVGNDERLLWPHASYMLDSNFEYRICDGVKLKDYACSTELFGLIAYPNTVKINGIGTICHEFSHVLGLPDFYDVDFDDSGGISHDPAQWSVMSGGNIYNSGRTPVGYSLYERYLLGFVDEPTVIDSIGHYTLEPLCSSLHGYRLNAPNENEFFLFENRQQDLYKWDTYLPGNGMLVYRVEYDPAIWKAEKINVDPSHNYYELLRAGGYEGYASPSDAFPGIKDVRALTNNTSPANLLNWAGEANDYGITNIALDSISKNITFSVDSAAAITEDPETAIVGVSQQSSGNNPLPAFNLSGQRVGTNYKGLVIKNGIKTLQK